MSSSRTTQWGLATESTVGAAVAASLFVPVTKFEPKVVEQKVMSEAMVAGLRGRQEWQVNGGPVAVSCAVGGELTARSFGGVLGHAIGPNDISTTGPTSSYYEHTIVTGSQNGKTFTQQGSIEDDAGTAQPWTLPGSKFKSFSLAWDEASAVNWEGETVAQRRDIGTRTLSSCETTNTSTAVVVTGATDDLEGMTISGTGIPTGAWITAVNSATSITISAAATATNTGLSLVVGRTLASASYTTTNQKLLKAHHAHVSVAGSEVPTYGGTWQITKPIPDTDFINGSRWSREQKDNGDFDDISGTFECEYNAALLARYLKGETFTVVNSFVRGTDALTLTSRAQIMEGAEPTVARGTSRNRMSVPWMAVGDTNADLLTAVLVTRDSTI